MFGLLWLPVSSISVFQWFRCDSPVRALRPSASLRASPALERAPVLYPVLAVGTLNVMPCGAFTDERLMGRYGFAPKVSFGLAGGLGFGV